MRSTPLVLLLFLSTACTRHTPPPDPIAPPPATSTAPRPTTTPTSEYAERTTTQDGITATVRYPREAILGDPIRVTFTLVNHGHQTVYITYSDPTRFVWPTVLWPAGRAKLPHTPLGERKLTNRGDETNNKTGPLAPGDQWSHTFDLTDYYQLPIAHKYYLTTSTKLEYRDAIDPDAWLQFDIGGMLIDVEERKAPLP